jgi:hypothetical protein
MNRTRATFLLLAVSFASLGATGCHRHRVARGVYPTMYQPVAYQRMAAPQPIVIVVETRGQAAPEVSYTQDNGEQDAAAREVAARAEAERQARVEREQAERARREQERAERARREQEQAQRDAQARAAAAQGQTTIIVLSPGAKPVQVDGSWFQGQ